jgi:restriction endonuclease S subunit
MTSHLTALAQVQTAVMFRGQAPQEDPHGNALALAIRDIVGGQPLRWHDLPRVSIPDKYLAHCLRPGDVVIPSRGDYYKSWLFEGAGELVFPMGHLNVVRPGRELDAHYLVWYLNQKSTQTKISTLLTGTSIKALTKAALLMLDVEVPPLSKQQQIAELDYTTKKIVAIRHRLNELDKEEIAYLTRQILKSGGNHA